jgi:hypothetical protein
MPINARITLQQVSAAEMKERRAREAAQVMRGYEANKAAVRSYAPRYQPQTSRAPLRSRQV